MWVNKCLVGHTHQFCGPRKLTIMANRTRIINLSRVLACLNHLCRVPCLMDLTGSCGHRHFATVTRLNRPIVSTNNFFKLGQYIWCGRDGSFHHNPLNTLRTGRSEHRGDGSMKGAVCTQRAGRAPVKEENPWR